MTSTHVPRFFRRDLRVRLHAGAILGALMLATAGDAVVAQNDDARFADWGKVESAAETRTFKEAMRGGGAFDAKARDFLEQVALPQLELKANRPKIESVRRRMRELLLGDIVEEIAADDANAAVLAFLQALANKQAAEPVVRVNAMLMIGEMQGPDRNPLRSATPVLARATSNADLPKAVRIAACVGLLRHAEATKGRVEEQRRLGPVANPAILAVLEEYAASGPAAADDWLASRCLSMLPLLGAGTPATVTAIARILGDDTRSIDVRVRAAAALAATAGPGAQVDAPVLFAVVTDGRPLVRPIGLLKVDAAVLIPVVLSLAVTSLERDASAADLLVLERQSEAVARLARAGTSGGDPPDGIGDVAVRPEVEQLIPREVCRRAAWRLAVLADSILTDDSKRGLAIRVAEGEDRTGFLGMAQKLRRAAMQLDAAPEEATLRQALAELRLSAPETESEEEPDAPTDPQ